jgi:hypothetical protein
MELKSCAASGNGLVAKGVVDGLAALSLELKESVLSEEGTKLEVLWCVGCAGGTSPFPLPRMRPPPSLRPDIVLVKGFEELRQLYREMLEHEVGV